MTLLLELVADSSYLTTSQLGMIETLQHYTSLKNAPPLSHQFIYIASFHNCVQGI